MQILRTAGIICGDYEDVLNVWKGEIELGAEYRPRHNFGKMRVYTVAGEEFEEDFSGFQQLGIAVDKAANVEVMKVPIVGDAGFLRLWGEKKLGDIRKAMDALVGVKNKHVGLYLLRAAMDVCKIIYITRATPRHMIKGLLQGFDESLVAAVGEVVGWKLEERQREQMELGVK